MESDNRKLRRIFGSKGEKVRNCVMESCITYVLHERRALCWDDDPLMGFVGGSHISCVGEIRNS
jgi:hypothetical protein